MVTRSFDKYVVTRLLGRGGMAEVYQAYDPDLDRHVAVKVIHPHLASDADFGERFRREAKLVASLRHPHIVQLFDYDVADGQPFMVMEYLDGGTLKEHLARHREGDHKMPLGEVGRLLERLADALDQAHAQGAVHRDIKPTNIIFTARGEPVLTDFGIAKILSDAAQLSASGSIVGTPAYMSPEQAAGGAVDARSDLYSLGVVLYEMVTGRVPFEGDSPTAVMLQHLSESPPPPRTFNPNIPTAVEGMILRALAKKPEDRFASAGELARAFRAALEGQAPVAEDRGSTPEAATILVLPSAGTAPLGGGQAVVPDVEGGDAAGEGPPSADSPTAGALLDSRTWLTRLTNVAEFVAPLVGHEVPTIRDVPQDRRGLLLALLGIIGILCAVLEFVTQALDLLVGPAAPLVRAWPYLVALLLVAGAGGSLYLALRAPVRVHRRRATRLLSLIVVVALAWGAWSIYSRLAPPGGFMVAIAEFDGSQATRRVDFARRIFEQLQNELADIDAAVSIVRTHETYPDAATARARAAARKATFVIWGWYDDAGVSPHVELLRLPSLQRESLSIPFLLETASAAPANFTPPREPRVRDLTRYVRTPAVMTDFDLFVRHGPEQMTYISAALLGLAFWLEGDAERALALYDKALANAPAGGAEIVGQEVVYFQRAMVLYQQNRVEDATADLERAIAIAPDLFEAHFNLAIAYAESCDAGPQLDRAIAAAMTAVRLAPDDAKVHELLGDLYRQAGRYDRAVAEFQAALRLGSADAAIYERLAAAYTVLGQEDTARAAQQRAVTLRQEAISARAADPGAARLALGDTYVAAGEYDKALAEYQAALQLAPDNPGVRRGLGNAYYWTGQLDLAEREYRAWAELAPDAVDARLILGLLYNEQGRSEEAIIELQQAADLAPCSAPAHMLLGGIYVGRGDYVRAAAEYQAAVALDPQNADALYLLGVTQYLQAEQTQDPSLLEEAETSLQAALALRPESVEARYALGGVYFSQGAYEEAAREWQRVAETAPDEPIVYTSLAHAYEKLQRLDEAIAAYQKALALRADADTHVYLGLIYQQQGNYEAAIAEYRQAVALDPQNALAYSALGEVYDQQGKLDEAATAFKQALALAESAALHAQLAGVYRRQGDLAAATAEYERAVALDPQDWQSRLQLGRLYSEMGQLDRAEEHFRAALAANSKSPEIRYSLGFVAYKRCDLSTMEQEMKAAAALAPESVLYQGALAAVHEARGRDDEAAGIYAEMQAATVGDAVAHLLAGDYLLRTSRLDEATREFQLVLEAPNSGPVLTSLAHSGLGQLYAARDQVIPAMSQFRLAARAFPANADAQAWLGDLALRTGNAGSALAAYDRATALLPEHAQQISADNAAVLAVSLHARRGLALTRQGKTADAAATFDQAVALAQAMVSQTPQWPWAHFALALARAARGDTAQAAAEFDAAAQCDQSLVAERARLEAHLAKLR